MWHQLTITALAIWSSVVFLVIVWLAVDAWRKDGKRE